MPVTLPMHGSCLGMGYGCALVCVTPLPSVCPIVVEEWQRRGGQPWQLIEPVDGFHPNEVSASWRLPVATCVIIL